MENKLIIEELKKAKGHREALEYAIRLVEEASHGCSDCKYRSIKIGNEPCRSCNRAYMSKWEATNEV